MQYHLVFAPVGKPASFSTDFRKTYEGALEWFNERHETPPIGIIKLDLGGIGFADFTHAKQIQWGEAA